MRGTVSKITTKLGLRRNVSNGQPHDSAVLVKSDRVRMNLYELQDVQDEVEEEDYGLCHCIKKTSSC